MEGSASISHYNSTIIKNYTSACFSEYLNASTCPFIFRFKLWMAL